MIYEIPFTIETLTPVVLSDKSGDAVLTGTKDYFSGNAIRGALASAYIRSNKLGNAEKDQEFYDFFLSGKLEYIPAYLMNEDNVIAQPIPASLQKSKLPQGEEKRIKVIDFSAGDEPAAGYKSMKGHAFMQNARITTAIVKKRLEFHMSRNTGEERITGSSNDGKIYNYESINAGQRFGGYIKGTKEDLNFFVSAFNNKVGFRNGEGIVYFGRSKFTQYGKCKFKLGNSVCVESKFEHKNGKLYLYCYSDFMPAKMFLEIKEAFGDMATRLSSCVPCHVGECYADAESVNSFVGVWGIKAPEKRVIKAGAVVEFVKDDKSEWNTSDLSALNQCIDRGVGKKGVEGYGQFRIWTPQKWKVEETKKELIYKPKEIHAEVRKVVKGIIDKYIKETMEETAAKHVAEITNIHDNNHLFGRLENIINRNGNIAAEIKETQIAASTLKGFKLKGKSLYEILCSYGDNKISMEEQCPYSKEFNEMLSNVRELAKDVNIELPKITDKEIHKIYWCWFCRLARVNQNTEGK